MPITEREHIDLENRVARQEDTLQRHLDDYGVLRSRMDRLDGMATMLKIILGTSVLGAITGLVALGEIVAHATGSK